ncbi:uncharacterized protein M8220_013263 [Acridotheres tristis]
MNEISSLKNLWIKALSIPGKTLKIPGETLKIPGETLKIPAKTLKIPGETGEDGESTEAEQQVPLPGSPRGFGDPQSRFFGLSNHPWELLPQKLIPLLRAVLHVLEENRKTNLSPECPGNSSRSTLKAPAAHPELLKSEKNQEITPAPKTSPAQRISHLQQEMQRRFLWEKHSWERAHLEMSLLAQEMGSVCSFYQSCQGWHPGPGKHPREAEPSPDCAARMLWVSGMRMVKLEALGQRCLYRVLDLYSHLQTGACPEGASRILRGLRYQNAGEEAAREAAGSREQQHAARALHFLQLHHGQGSLLQGFGAQAEAELRKMRARFRLEIQIHTEEKLRGKEAEAMQENSGGEFGDFVTFSLLSQRHLRQRVTLLQDCHRLRSSALRWHQEGTGLEQLLAEDLSMDEQSRDILQLLEDTTEFFFLVLEFIEAVRLLQLRENHYKEMIRNLKSCNQKFVDDANITTKEVKKFREQKMRKLKEHLEHFLEKKKTPNFSSGFEPFQGLMRKSSLAKDFQLEAQRTRLGGDKKGKMQQNSQNSQIPGTHPKAEDQLLQFLTTSIKVLKQAEHLMASRITLLNPQLTALPLHGDGMKCGTSSFLLGLLQEVNDELRRNAGAAGLGQSQRLQKTEIAAQEGELSSVDPAALSPREFVVFQYGLSILQFLTFHVQAPEFSLAVASSLPRSAAPGNAFRNSFFYQNSKKKLFILRECLGSGGGFLLVLVHCWAHVTAGDLSHDTNPLFLSLFHQALKACLGEMFSLRLQLSAAAPGSKSQGINQILLKEEPFSTEEINLISQLLEVRVKNLTDVEAFEKDLLLRVKSEESLRNKWLVKKKENFHHPLSSSGRESLGQRAHLEEETVASLSPSELEDQVDALTEELLQIVEEEQHFLSREGNEDLLSYYLEITSLEKQSLGKQIKALEEEIAQGRKL